MIAGPVKHNVNEKGYYGSFGGAFIPEMLHPNIEELRENYLKIIDDEKFKEEYDDLLRDFVGRPTPLYFAKRLSAHYKAKIYLKREDLCHTGAHKVNNTVGQILLAKRLGLRVWTFYRALLPNVLITVICALATVLISQYVNFEASNAWKPVGAVAIVLPPVWFCHWRYSGIRCWPRSSEWLGLVISQVGEKRHEISAGG
jgi:hypothetical protein